jgi:hypothetical protein
MRTIILVLQLAFGLSTAAQTQPTSYFWWIAELDRALPDNPATAKKVLYGPQPTLRTTWVFKNDEGREAISLVPQAFVGASKISVFRAGDQVPAELAWIATGTWRTAAGEVDVLLPAPLVLGPEESLEWHASLRRTDKLAWSEGDYEIRIDMTQALANLQVSGKPWTGRAERYGTIAVRIAEEDSLKARKMTLLLDLAEATRERRYRDAVTISRNLVKLDPTDRGSHASLGRALVANGEFKEAITELEIASAVSDRGPVPEALAFAYVALGDEINAARVLRLVTTEDRVPAELTRLRAAAKKR